MKKSFFVSLFFILFVSILTRGPSLYAQSNELIDKLLAEEVATFGETAVLVLSGAGLIGDSSSEGEAISYIRDKNWGFKEIKADSPVTAGALSLLIMQAFDIPGGIFYSLFHGKRYAYREMVYLGLITKRGGPYRKLSGEEVLRVLQGALEWKEVAK